MFFVKCGAALFLVFIAESALRAGTTAASASRTQERIPHAAATGTLMLATASPDLCAPENRAVVVARFLAMSVGGRRPQPRRPAPNHDAARPSNWRFVAAPEPLPVPQRQAIATAPPHPFASPLPASSSSTPVPRRLNPDFIPGLRPAAAWSPTPAPPGFGGHSAFTSGDDGGLVRGYTMAARRGAAPFFNSDGSIAGGASNVGGGGSEHRTSAARNGAAPIFNPGTEAGGSAAPAPSTPVPARWNATAAANQRPGLIRTWVNVPPGEAARRLQNGAPHQEQAAFSTSEEYTPA